MQAASQAKPAVGILLDSDMGGSIDDALALALLFGLESKSEARVVAASVSYPNLRAAAFCEAIARFYTGPFSRLLPTGLTIGAEPAPDTPMIQAVLSRQDEKGAPLYLRTIRTVNDTSEPHAMLRNALTAQHDQNAIVVLSGPATNLAALLTLPGAAELVTEKVRYLVAAAGAFGSATAPDRTIQADVAAAKKLFAEWPTPIFACGAEAGGALTYPGTRLEKDLAWADPHPVVDAYRAYKSAPYDVPAWAAAAVLYAARPQENYFAVSEPGSITVSDDGRTMFHPGSGKHRLLKADPTQTERILGAWSELFSAKPSRQPRRPVPQQQQQQQQAPAAQPPKPASQ